MTINDNYEENNATSIRAIDVCPGQMKMTLGETKREMVNHPNHYQAGGLECIDVMEQLYGREAVESWIKLTIFKYAWRADKKDGAQDVDKIRWYSDKLVQMLREDGKY